MVCGLIPDGNFIKQLDPKINPKITTILLLVAPPEGTPDFGTPQIRSRRPEGTCGTCITGSGLGIHVGIIRMLEKSLDCRGSTGCIAVYWDVGFRASTKGSGAM